MGQPKYFSYNPDLEYAVSVDKAGHASTVNIKDYFNLSRVRDDVYKQETLYVEYYVKDGERPEQISYSLYGSEAYYWVVLQVNDIVDYYNEWPLSQTELNEFILKKYGSYVGAEQIHHYETVETHDAEGNLVLPGGMVVPEDFVFTYPEHPAYSVYLTSRPYGVTNSLYEQRENEKKSKIQVLQKKYIYDYVRDTRLNASRYFRTKVKSEVAPVQN